MLVFSPHIDVQCRHLDMAPSHYTALGRGGGVQSQFHDYRVTQMTTYGASQIQL
jgi:hypothetical protein